MLAPIRKHIEFSLMNGSASTSTGLVLAVAFRCCVTVLVVGTVSVADADDARPRKPLSSAEKFQQDASDVGELTNAGDEAGLLNLQFKSFGTWTAIEPVAATNPDIRTGKTTIKSDADQNVELSRPLIIPRLIDHPDGIEDQNVGPIPTQPHETIQDSSREGGTMTIPVVPNAGELVASRQANNSASDKGSPSPENDLNSQVDAYDAAPQLLTHSDESPTAVTNILNAPQASVRTLAMAQLISTFLGVLLAVGLFLLIRVATMKFFGVNLGITFRLGAISKATAETITENDSADVVPFGTQTSPSEALAKELTESENRRNVADTADFNFRVIGSDHGDDAPSSEGSVNLENEAGILKSIFEQNLNLMQELDQQNESAA